MRVTQICNTLSASDGGPARHALEVNAALNDLGVDVQLYAAHASADELTTVFRRRSDIFFREPKAVRGVHALAAAIRSCDILIVHGYYLRWAALAVAIARVEHKPVLLMPHGALTRYDRSSKPMKKWLFHIACGWWMNRIVRFVVATEREARDLREHAPGAQVSTVGAGASGAASAPSKELHSPVALLSLSRIAPKKRIDLAIRTLSLVRRQGIDATLRIGGVGDIELVSRLRALADAEGVTSHVEFVGHVEGREKELLFEASDILLLLSDDENFGIGLAEALVRGLPAVTTTAVAAASGMSSSFCPQIEPGAIETAARHVAEIAGDYAPRSLAARGAAEAAFSWNRVAKRWSRVLQDAFSEHQRRTTKFHDTNTKNEEQP